jgi:hypothetical protein
VISHARKFGTMTLPIAITLAYQLVIPLWVRRRLSEPPGTSTAALRAIRAGGGWAAFWWYALPRRNRAGLDGGDTWMPSGGSRW